MQYSITYSYYTVSNWRELKDKLNQELSSEIKYLNNSKIIFLINCGGSEDIKASLKISLNIRFYIIDARRPIHYKNLMASNTSVVVFLPNDLVTAVKDIINELEKIENKYNHSSIE